MKGKVANIFVLSVGVLFSFTAIGKLISALGTAQILRVQDPIFSIPFQYMLLISGVIEIIAALFCFFGSKILPKIALTAWLATSFLIYRLGLIWIGYQKPCSCLGDLADALRIPPQATDISMKFILAYLLIGSYAILVWHWGQHRKTEGKMVNDEISPTESSEMGVGS